MNAKPNVEKGSRMTWSHYSLIIKCFIVSTFILTGMQLPLQAQDSIQYSKPSWYFGVAAGGNINFYRGSTQQLNSTDMAPTTFHNGNGIGLFLAPIIEFRPASSFLGVMLQAGYDSRRGGFARVTTPCNCPADLYTNLSYITIEPSLRIAPFGPDFYLYAGPRFAFNVSKAFTYQQGTNPAYPTQVEPSAVKDNFSNINQNLISMQIGAGYDIHLTAQGKRTQFVISPFVAFQPYYGQDPRSIETWNITTLRFGAAFKFGSGHKMVVPVKEVLPTVIAAVIEPDVTFSVNSPKNIPTERRVIETFPVLNDVFFDLGSTEIPSRYTLLTKDQVTGFKTDQPETFTSGNLSGRSGHQLAVYYNILNILGDRMVKNPSATIILVGSSEKGPEDALDMAKSVKQYLVNIFGINPSRIRAEGQTNPKVASEQPGGTIDLVLLRQEDRRVSIESNSPALLMEYQNGPNAPLKPVEMTVLQEAPFDSYVTFNAKGAKEAFSSWSMEIRDEQGNVQYYGPFSTNQVSLPGKDILGNRPEGNYNVTMIGKTMNGKTIREETPVHMVLWTPPTTEKGMRFCIVFEFNKSTAIGMYKRYLTDIVTPKIPKNASVIIHGHTDIIGDSTYNQQLSLARANEVKNIISKALSKANRNDVNFKVFGFGEDQSTAPFENKFPEGRFYNRTVIIDIVPQPASSN
jgi:outer membrane protein OmpA-like peptidoglycan-associated protein